MLVHKIAEDSNYIIWQTDNSHCTRQCHLLTYTKYASTHQHLRMNNGTYTVTLMINMNGHIPIIQSHLFHR